MEHIKKFKTQDEFLTEKPNLPYPCVSYVEETQNVEYEKQSIITAKYIITQDVIDGCVNSGLTEIPLITIPQGSLESYTINGEKFGPFEEPQYEITENEIIYVETSIEGIGNCFGISKNNCVEGGIGLFNTAMTWTIDRKIDLDNDYICMSMTDGEMYQPLCTSLQGQQSITLHSDNKSFSLTQDYCDSLNSSANVGVFLGFSIVESSCVTILNAEYGIGLITSQPTTVTTFKGMALLNADKISPNSITVPCTQDDLNTEYEVKYILSKSATSVGLYEATPLYEIDLSKLDENRVFSIGDSAFYYCSGLTSVTIGNSVTSIGDSAFYSCRSLTSVTIPDSVTSIGRSAFYNCSGLTSVTIGSGVTKIDYYAFDFCTKLTRVNITSLEAWCNINFENDDSNPLNYAKNLYLNGELITELIIPNSVTSIGNYAFGSCHSLTTVTIPDSITSIGNSAFTYCSGLTEIVMSDSVTSIGNYVFGRCYSLTSVTIPNSVTSIGNGAFQYCNHLTSVTIGNGVTSIGNSTFYGCSSLTEILIPDSVTSIGSSAFYNCSGLTSVTIGDGVTSIGTSAFTYCSGLTSVTIPNSVKTIDKCVFYNCTSLTSVTIPDSVTSIGNSAFSKCSGLTSVTIPDSVTSIVDGAFSDCYNLTSVTIGDGVTSIGVSAFYLCSGLTSVTIGSGVTSIGSGAFKFCSGLTEIVIPDSVTSIGSSAFASCVSLTSVTIGDSVTSIGNSAFEKCHSLTSITCNSITAPRIDSYTFYWIPSNGVLKYPKGSDYSSWMSTSSYYLGYYNWTSQEIEE